MSTPTTYMLLLWGDPDAYVDLEAAYAAHGAFAEQCALLGHEIVGGEELASPREARVLTVTDGAAHEVTDGPFAETTEQLGGFYLVRTADPGGLLRLAAPLVMDDGGTLELRPVVVHDAATPTGDLAGERCAGVRTCLLLLRGDPTGLFDLDAVMAAHDRFTRACPEHGHEIVGGEELGDATAARLLRVGPDGPTICDGPYAEVTEQIGGYYLVRTADPDGLLRMAAPLVEAEGRGSIELRPVATHDGAGPSPADQAAATQPVP